MRIEVENRREFDDAMRASGDRVRLAVERAVQAAGTELRAEAVRRVQRGPKSGVVYDSIFRVINGRVVPVGPRAGNNLSPTHQSSAKGQSPASDTGALARSISYRMESSMVAVVVAGVQYANWLEYGTRRMDPRPFMGPAAEAIRPAFRRRVDQAIQSATR